MEITMLQIKLLRILPPGDQPILRLIFGTQALAQICGNRGSSAILKVDGLKACKSHVLVQWIEVTPKEIIWKTVPHRLFFGRFSARTWGTGGVAFLHLESDSQNKAYMCLYKKTNCKRDIEDASLDKSWCTVIYG